jgi:hypothetical protein
MYVVVQHRVKDPEFFFADVPAIAQNAPPGVHPRMFCPSQDQTAAVCLWQADSIDAVRAYIDSATGDASENSYFEVSKVYAVGLPDAVGSSRR